MYGRGRSRKSVPRTPLEGRLGQCRASCRGAQRATAQRAVRSHVHGAERHRSIVPDLILDELAEADLLRLGQHLLEPAAERQTRHRVEDLTQRIQPLERVVGAVALSAQQLRPNPSSGPRSRDADSVAVRMTEILTDHSQQLTDLRRTVQAMDERMGGVNDRLDRHRLVDAGAHGEHRAPK